MGSGCECQGFNQRNNAQGTAPVTQRPQCRQVRGQFGYNSSQVASRERCQNAHRQNACSPSTSENQVGVQASHNQNPSLIGNNASTKNNQNITIQNRQQSSQSTSNGFEIKHIGQKVDRLSIPYENIYEIKVPEGCSLEQNIGGVFQKVDPSEIHIGIGGNAEFKVIDKDGNELKFNHYGEEKATFRINSHDQFNKCLKNSPYKLIETQATKEEVHDLGELNIKKTDFIRDGDKKLLGHKFSIDVPESCEIVTNLKFNSKNELSIANRGKITIQIRNKSTGEILKFKDKNGNISDKVVIENTADGNESLREENRLYQEKLAQKAQEEASKDVAQDNSKAEKEQQVETISETPKANEQIEEKTDASITQEQLLSENTASSNLENNAELTESTQSETTAQGDIEEDKTEGILATESQSSDTTESTEKTDDVAKENVTKVDVIYTQDDLRKILGYKDDIFGKAHMNEEVLKTANDMIYNVTNKANEVTKSKHEVDGLMKMSSKIKVAKTDASTSEETNEVAKDNTAEPEQRSEPENQKAESEQDQQLNTQVVEEQEPLTEEEIKRMKQLVIEVLMLNKAYKIMSKKDPMLLSEDHIALLLTPEDRSKLNLALQSTADFLTVCTKEERESLLVPLLDDFKVVKEKIEKNEIGGGYSATLNFIINGLEGDYSQSELLSSRRLAGMMDKFIGITNEMLDINAISDPEKHNKRKELYEKLIIALNHFNKNGGYLKLNERKEILRNIHELLKVIK